MRLSPHFLSAEFDCRNGAPVPGYALDDLQRLCRLYLEPLRAVYGPVEIISGYRTRTYNMQVGGAPHSFHVYSRERFGAAADVRCARGHAAQWYRALDRLGPGGLGRYDAHVHVDNRAGHARW